MWLSFASGILFGLGLAVSNMLNPERVLAFLDLFGVWDPTLAFVMGGALSITIPGFYWASKRKKPFFSSEFSLPTKTDIDKPLVLGAVMFGIGWGLVGLCPGPAIAALVSLDVSVFMFAAVMLASWMAADRFLVKN